MSRRRAAWIALVLVAGACGPPGPPPARGTVIGSTSVAIDTRSTATRTGESPVGDFIADTLRAANAALGDAAELALLNAGAIRGGRTTADSVPVTVEAKLGRVYGPGELTDDDVEGWFPFRDDHVVETVTGLELKGALERGAAQLPPDLRADGGGPLLDLSGGAYTIDCAGDVQTLDLVTGMIARAGTRVVHLEVGGRVLYDRAAGIDELAATDVRIVVNDFVSRGFDGHVTLAAGRDVHAVPFDTLSLSAALVARVAASSPIAPENDGRITVVGDCGAPLTPP